MSRSENRLFTSPNRAFNRFLASRLERQARLEINREADSYAERELRRRYNEDLQDGDSSRTRRRAQ